MADPPEQAAAQQADAPRANVGDIGRIDLNIAAFVQPTDSDDAALLWERWLTRFVRKLRFFRVNTVDDKIDAL